MANLQTDHETILAALLGAGLRATWEYPGALCLNNDDGTSWWFGTANPTWYGDLMAEDGACLRSINLRIPSDSDDVAAIVLAIGAAITTKTCPECGGTMAKHDGLIAEEVMRTGTGETSRAVRPAVYWACAGCEHCEEVTRG